MRFRRASVALLSWSLLIAACSGSGASSPASIAPVPTDVATTSVPVTEPATTVAPTTAPPTTQPEQWDVVFELDEIERLAARRGVSVVVFADGIEAGSLSDEEPRLEALVNPGAVASFQYIGSNGMPDVEWTRTVDGPGLVPVVQSWREPGTAVPYVLAWQTGSDRAKWLAEVDSVPQLTVSSPMTWFVSADGSVSGSVDTGFVAAAHERGLLVWPAVQGLDADALHEMVSDAGNIDTIAQRISDDAMAAGADGVNIDIEGFRHEDSPGITALILTLRDLVHEWGGVVSYDLVPRTDSWDITPEELAYWSTAPERREIAKAVDYTILMSYDQHNRFRPAGPVADPEWVEDTIVYMLRYADPHTVMLGIPAYGRIWDSADLESPKAVSLGVFPGLGGEASDDPFVADRYDLADGRFYWAEHDHQADRMDLADEYGLSGWAVWRLGLDDPSLWAALP